MPENPLTEILRDFRKYRPGNHKDFLVWISEVAQGGQLYPSVKDYALQNSKSTCKYQMHPNFNLLTEATI